MNINKKNYQNTYDDWNKPKFLKLHKSHMYKAYDFGEKNLTNKTITKDCK